MVYLQASIKLYPGKQQDFVSLINELLPVVGKHGWKLVGSYAAIVGRLNTVVDLWEIPNTEAVQAVLTDPEMAKRAHRIAEIVEQSDRDGREPRFGVALRRGRIAVDRAEIALPIDERRAHREVLRHAHESVVDRKLAVRMILTDHVAHGARRLVVGAVGCEVELAHRV